MAHPTSIFQLKQGFLESQARLLSGELRPPKNWQDEIPAGAEGDLPQKVVDAVLTKLNLVSRKHCRSVYSAQTMRRVAEQVEALYQQAEEGAGAGAGEGLDQMMGGTWGGVEVLKRGVDLADVGYVWSFVQEREKLMRDKKKKNLSQLTLFPIKHYLYAPRGIPHRP